VSNLVSALTSAHNVASNAISNEISARAASIQTLSAAVTSVDTRVNAVSQQVSVLSQQVSLLSQLHSALSQAHSALSSQVSVVSVNLTSVDAHAAAASAAATSVLAYVSAASAKALSAGGASTHGLQSVVNVLSNRISIAQAAGSGSIASAELVPLQLKLVTGSQVISASALTNISGLSATVSAGVTYRLQAMVLVDRGVASETKYGLTFPAMTRVRGKVFTPLANVQGQPTVSTLGYHVGFEGDSASGSVLISIISTAAALVSTFVQYTAVMLVSTTGTVQLQAAGQADTAAIAIQPGSYLEVYRLG
jgi:hypothetical protein